MSELLLSGAVLGRIHVPHEHHIPYLLQFLSDHNLYGMAMMKLRRFRFRPSIKARLMNTSSLSCTHYLSTGDGNHFGKFLWHPNDEIERVTHVELELDSWPWSIENFKDVVERATEPFQPSLCRMFKLVPSLEAICEDERRRSGRRNNCVDLLSSQSGTQRSCEELLKQAEILRQTILSSTSSKPSQVTDSDALTMFPSVMTAFQAISALYPISEDSDLTTMSQYHGTHNQSYYQYPVDDCEPYLDESVLQHQSWSTGPYVNSYSSYVLQNSNDDDVLDILTAMNQASEESVLDDFENDDQDMSLVHDDVKYDEPCADEINNELDDGDGGGEEILDAEFWNDEQPTRQQESKDASERSLMIPQYDGADDDPMSDASQTGEAFANTIVGPSRTVSESTAPKLADHQFAKRLDGYWSPLSDKFVSGQFNRDRPSFFYSPPRPHSPTAALLRPLPPTDTPPEVLNISLATIESDSSNVDKLAELNSQCHFTFHSPLPHPSSASLFAALIDEELPAPSYLNPLPFFSKEKDRPLKLTRADPQMLDFSLAEALPVNSYQFSGKLMNPMNNIPGSEFLNTQRYTFYAIPPTTEQLRSSQTSSKRTNDIPAALASQVKFPRHNSSSV